MDAYDVAALRRSPRVDEDDVPTAALEKLVRRRACLASLHRLRLRVVRPGILGYGAAEHNANCESRIYKRDQSLHFEVVVEIQSRRAIRLFFNVYGKAMSTKSDQGGPSGVRLASKCNVPSTYCWDMYAGAMTMVIYISVGMPSMVPFSVSISKLSRQTLFPAYLPKTISVRRMHTGSISLEIDPAHS